MTDICKYEVVYYMSILYQLQYFLGSYTECIFLIELSYYISYVCIIRKFIFIMYTCHIHFFLYNVIYLLTNVL
jgi:hypothetical protein